MKITHYLYNAFVIEAGDKTIAVDPGALFLYYFRLTPLIPKSEWGRITHIFVTHGDPDHYWHADRVAKASNAAVICNQTMVRRKSGNTFMLGPRRKGLSFATPLQHVHPLSVGESLELDGMRIRGIRATHGPLKLKLGPLEMTVTPGPDERIGWGAIGFDIELDGMRIVNLGDTLLEASEWRSIDRPDVLMIPIGGRAVHNTMDEDEALEAVRIIRPAIVIPCHYNCPGLFSRNYNPADALYFRRGVEALGLQCIILGKGEFLEIPKRDESIKTDPLHQKSA